MRRAFLSRRQAGFTLIEAVVVMVITSILAGVMVLFIRRPVQQYVDAAERSDLTDVADLALRRMARELRGALPNSIRVLALSSGVMIEFIPTKSGGIYLDAADDAGSGFPLDFTSSASTQFNVVGNLSVLPTATDYIVVYNLGSGFQRADAYSNTAGSMNRAAIAQLPTAPTTTDNVTWDGVATTAIRINLFSNPFAVAAGAVPNASPSHRFQVVTQPVTFRCAPQSPGGPVLLTRHWNYGFNPAVSDPLGTGSSALLANNVSSCTFNYASAANIQHGLVGLNVTLARATASANESVTLSQQVNVENTP